MNKSVLITGGAKRIGKAIALNLADKGYNIGIHYNSSEDEAIKTCELISGKGVKCHTFRYNLENVKQLNTLVSDVKAKLPNCTILINNASLYRESEFKTVSEMDFDRDFTINFKSPFFLSQSFAINMDAELIINLLDAKITKNNTKHFVYNLSKKMLYHFTLMSAHVLAPNVRVNGICLGSIIPPPGKGMEYLNKVASRIPLKKPGNINNIITAVNYLIENEFVTGECLYVDGGEHLTQ